MKKKNILLIIGNGFDLELGLKTSYKNFIESDIYDSYSKKISESLGTQKTFDIRYDVDINIFKYFKDILSIQNWIDLEVEIGKLAGRYMDLYNSETRCLDKRLAVSSNFMMSSFNSLRDCLNDYILNLEVPDNSPNNYALQIMSILGTNKYDNVEIVTFNYTDLNETTGLDIQVPVYHIHGKVSKGYTTNLILGIQDSVEVDKSFSYVIKSHSPYYHSSHIIDMLESADEVIFFGHSLGETDYPYFSDFFKMQCQKTAPEDRKKIRIFTYDEKSRLDILFQLRMMNDKQTRLFFENSDFALYRTVYKIDDIQIQEYFKELISDLSYH